MPGEGADWCDSADSLKLTSASASAVIVMGLMVDIRIPLVLKYFNQII
jgi:hypothetical protein